LMGWDEDWIYTDSKNRRATFTNIPSGDYTLLVKAGNSDGYWSVEPKSLKITLTPAPWKTWQAYLAYVVLFVSGLLLLFKYRTQTIVNRAKELEQGVRQRTETINQLMTQKQQMFANISHEFKTPLTLILSPLEVLLQDPKAQAFKAKTSMMKRNAQRLLRMIEQLLELSDLEAGQNEKRSQYSLAQVMNVLLCSFEPLFENKKLTVNSPSLAYNKELTDNKEFEDVTLSMKTDALEIILGNLISNAIKYTPEQGSITIDIERCAQNVIIAVQDTGIGIAPADQTQVFNRFTRVDDAQVEQIPGAGIGLALVKELVTNHDGQIELTSELGKGSTFTVTLPVCDTHSPNRDI
ncbi:MAG: ATP-binding protein, partial [Psychrosphaera sp.]|nr:ATP-binding protein [Psychrosphaera sp.]